VSAEHTRIRGFGDNALYKSTFYLLTYLLVRALHAPMPAQKVYSSQCLKWSNKEAGSLPQSEVECPSPQIFNLFLIWKWRVLMH